MLRSLWVQPGCGSPPHAVSRAAARAYDTAIATAHADRLGLLN